MKTILIILIAIIGFSSGIENPQSPSDSTDLQIRCILCRIKKGKYPEAENDLNTILQKDPQNIYARRLLPGVLAEQIVKDDRSPENMARIKKAIEAYNQFLKGSQISQNDRKIANNYIISLYEKLSAEERTGELLKRAADNNLTAPERSDIYVSLSRQSERCADEIIEDKPRLTKTEIEKATGCVSKGLEYVNQAITLNVENEMAWSYKSSLTRQSVKIAGFQNNQVQKVNLQKEYDQALKQYKVLSAKRKEKIEKEEREDKERYKSEAKENKQTAEDKELVGQILVHYKIEKPLDELVKGIYISHSGLDDLVAPVKIPGEKYPDEKLPKNTDDEKHEWKSFSLKDGELTIDLPDNTRFEDSLGGITIFAAGSEGVKFQVLSQPRDSIQTKNLDDASINALAWANVLTFKGFKAESGYEINFLRKISFDNQSAKIYQYSSGVCECETDGILLVLIGKKNNYIFDINGINEQDARFQHFLKSLKLN